MMPNLRPGKTELMISPKRHGTREWRKEMYGPLSNEHFTAVGEYGPYHIHLVTKMCIWEESCIILEKFDWN